MADGAVISPVKKKRLLLTRCVSIGLGEVTNEAKDVYHAVLPTLTTRRSIVNVDVLGMPSESPRIPISDAALISPTPPPAPPLPGQESQQMLGWTEVGMRCVIAVHISAHHAVAPAGGHAQ